MKCFYSPDYVVDAGDHIFPTKKFALTAERLRAQGLLKPDELEDPGLPDTAELLCAHTVEWVEKALKGGMSPAEEEAMQLRWSAEVSVAHRKAVKGTLLACRQALETGLGLHCGGGAHHAFAGHGDEGRGLRLSMAHAGGDGNRPKRDRNTDARPEPSP